MAHGLGRTADHHAVAALQAPHAAAGADVDIVDLFGCELLGAADVVHVVGVAAVDQDVAWLQVRHHLMDGLVNDSRRHHEPDRARRVEFLHQVAE